MKMKNQKPTNKFKISDFIEKWNKEYPFDRWWRKKYNIPFGSKVHKEASHIDMYFEYKEDLYFKNLKDEKTIEELKSEEGTLIGKIVALKQDKLLKKQSKADIDKDFDNL